MHHFLTFSYACQGTIQFSKLDLNFNTAKCSVVFRIGHKALCGVSAIGHKALCGAENRENQIPKLNTTKCSVVF